MPFEIDESSMIPVEPGQAVVDGWSATPFGKPVGVTMHWAVTPSLHTCTRIIGGANAARKGAASAHYGVGRTYEEGAARYVSLDAQSFHCQAGQLLRWDGRRMETKKFSGIRTTIGIETVHMGYAEPGEVAADRYIKAATVTGVPMEVQLWTDEQIDMLVAVGKEIINRWSGITVRDWHGHSDLAPKRKIDVTGFPFARLLRRVYDDDLIPDVWTLFHSNEARQKALVALGYPLAPYGADGDWGSVSTRGLKAFQRDNGMVANGYWSTFTCWMVYDVLSVKGKTIEEVVA